MSICIPGMCVLGLGLSFWVASKVLTLWPSFNIKKTSSSVVIFNQKLVFLMFFFLKSWCILVILFRVSKLYLHCLKYYIGVSNCQAVANSTFEKCSLICIYFLKWRNVNWMELCDYIFFNCWFYSEYRYSNFKYLLIRK